MNDALDMNPSNALDTVISTMLFAMSTIRSIMVQCTWLALTPLRFSWNISTWMISHTISITVTIATYPPVTTLLMVIGCGLLIGACAGFGVELITSMVLSATWGKEKKAINDPVMEHDDDQHQPIEQRDDLYDDDVIEMRLASKKSKHDLFDDDVDDDDGNEDPQVNHEADDAMYELLQHHLASVASNTNSDDNTQLRRRTPH